MLDAVCCMQIDRQHKFSNESIVNGNGNAMATEQMRANTQTLPHINSTLFIFLFLCYSRTETDAIVNDGRKLSSFSKSYRCVEWCSGKMSSRSTLLSQYTDSNQTFKSVLPLNMLFYVNDKENMVQTAWLYNQIKTLEIIQRRLISFLRVTTHEVETFFFFFRPSLLSLCLLMVVCRWCEISLKMRKI